MTPQQVEEAARRRYNAVNDTYWVQDEIFKIIYEGEQILATEALAIEAKDTSITTVSGTRIYDIPSLVIAIKRIEYNGYKLQPIDFREDDFLTLNNSSTADTGTPQFYTIWNSQIYLRPIPDAAHTLTLYCNKEATLLTTASTTLSTPTFCHSGLIDYTVAQMGAKDQKFEVMDRYDAKWERQVIRIKQWIAKRKRTDGYAVVKDEESMAVTLLGAI